MKARVVAVVAVVVSLVSSLLVTAPFVGTAEAMPLSCSVVVDGASAEVSWSLVDGVSTYVVRSQKPGEGVVWRQTIDNSGTSWTYGGHVDGEAYTVRYREDGNTVDTSCSVTDAGGGGGAGAALSCSVVVDGASAEVSWSLVDGVSTYVVRSQKPGEGVVWRQTIDNLSLIHI